MKKTKAKLMKIFAAMFVMAVTIIAGRGLTAEAASGSGSSTYYFNLHKEYGTTFSTGQVLYLTTSNIGIEDMDYMSYNWPEPLKAMVTVKEPHSGHYCDASDTGNVAGSHYNVAVNVSANGFDNCAGGCLTYRSENEWEYNCWYGGATNITVYIYTVQTGNFTASDVTFEFDSQGNITGAKLFAGKSDEVTVPVSMLNITDNVVNYPNGDYVRTATLGEVTTTVVDSTGVYNYYSESVGGLNLSPSDEQKIKDLLANAKNQDDVDRILAQAKALSEVDANAANAKTAIDNMPNLSDEEKTAKKNAIDSAVQAAKNNILSAASTSAVTSALNNGKDAIALVEAKAQAMNDLTAAADAQKAAINSNPNLGTYEKAALKEMLNEALDAAKKNVNSAKTTTEVTQAKNNGTTAIGTVGTQAAKVAEIAQAANAKKQAIEAMTDLSLVEKAALKSAIDDAAETAKNLVLSTTSEPAMNTAVANAKSAFELAEAKASATAAVTKKAKDEKAAIDAMANLTPTEKIILKQKVDDAAETAKNAISAAANPTAVNTAKTEGENAIDLIGEKAAAMDAVVANAIARKAEIDTYSQLTPAEKEQMKADVDAAVAAAKTAIENAATPSAVTAARDAGNTAVDLIQYKANVIHIGRGYRDRLHAAIDELPNLTPDEKAAMKNKVNDTITAYEAEVKNAATKSAVLDAVSKLNNAGELIKAQAQAMDEINANAAAKKAAVKALANLTNEEKAAKYAEIDAAAADAKANINAATNKGAIDIAQADGEAAMVLIQAKAEAMDALAEDVAAKIAEINEMKSLTKDQKAAFISEIESNKAASFEAINAVAETDAIAPIMTKSLAYNKVKEAEAKALDTVMAQKALTAEEQKAFADKIKESAAKAVADITEADPAAVDFEDTVDGIVNAMVVEVEDIADDAVALNFVKAYVTGKDGKVYTTINSENADQILSGKDVWAKMTEAQKAKADALIVEANKDIAGAPQSYEAFVKATEEFVAASADNFIKTYLTGKDGKIFKEADASNYQQILSGLETWNKLSQSEKDAINAKLTANGGKTYEELLKKAEEVDHYIKTGDSSNLVLWISLAMMSLVAMAYVSMKKRIFVER